MGKKHNEQQESLIAVTTKTDRKAFKAEQKALAAQVRAERRAEATRKKEEDSARKSAARADAIRGKEERAAQKSRKAEVEDERVAREDTEETHEWFKIDNAALIFVPSRNRNWTNQFRFACVLDEPVRPDLLQRAVNDLYYRFPTMMVYLKAGLFWNYFEGASRPPAVKEETAYPCRVFDVQARSYLIRIMYGGNRVITEFFHGITDGNGGIIYIMSLLKRYFELCGEEIPHCKYCVDYRDLPSDEEKEDAFTRYAEKGNRRPWSEKNSVQLKSTRAERGKYYVTHAVFSAEALKQKAHEYDLTISEYLAACLIWVLRRQYLSTRKKKSDRPLRLCVPVDLRRLKPSNTLRNFVLMYNIEHYPEVEADFDDVVAEVKAQFNMITPDYIQSFINKNVATAERFAVRILPRPIKNFCLNIAYRMFGLKQSAMSFSNLGYLELPEELSRHIRRTEFLLGPGKTRGVKAACVTVGDKLVLSFGADCVNHNVEAAFLRFVTEQGLEVTVDTNRRECNE